MGQPKPIGDILSQLMARRGYARVLASEDYGRAWSEAAGDAIAAQTRATQVRRGVLEVLVSHSLLIQEIGFRKSELLKRLAEIMPEQKIRDLRFRVGAIN